MNIIVKSRNMELTDLLRDHVEKKVNKLDRYLPNIEEARVELAVESTRSAGDRQVAQLTLRAKGGTILRAEDHSTDMQTSIDMVLDKMTRQIDRYKGKHWHSRNRVQAPEGAPSAAETETESDIVRIKRFPVRPMTVDEAIEQMELLGHDFFLFFDAELDNYSVIYKRRDGGYGLLQPELA